MILSRYVYDRLFKEQGRSGLDFIIVWRGFVSTGTYVRKYACRSACAEVRGPLSGVMGSED